MNNQENQKNLKDKKDQGPIINDKIRAVRVQLINHLGENVGVVARDEAIKMAEREGLDLVLLSEREGQEPIVKIMDFGKELYERKKKKTESKKHQKVIQVKEIEMRPMIGEHDFQTKMKQAVRFLEEGKRVKITLSFKGRENVLKDKYGAELFEKIQAVFDAHQISKNIMQEKDTKIGKLWSRIYYLK